MNDVSDGVSVFIKTLRNGTRLAFTTPLGCTINFGDREFSMAEPGDCVEEGPYKAAFLRGEKLGIETDTHPVAIQLLPFITRID